MARTTERWLQHRTMGFFLSLGALFLLLLLKFLWPLWSFDLPLGYDVGMYRYLFLRHAEALPPFSIAELPPWARGHPLGLFFFSTILIRLGLPVDLLLGWIWNLVPVVLSVTLALIWGKREGRTVGVLTLLASLLSVAYFDGFAAMYWKTYAALLWCVLTFLLLERRSLWSIPTAMLTIATHHQTGLLFLLAVLSWALASLRGIPLATILRRRDVWMTGGALLSILLLSIPWYLPIWSDAVSVHLPLLLHGEGPGGSFPDPSFYLKTSGILLLLGVYGWATTARAKRWSPWHWAVLWAAIFVVLRLFFFRRFFLQLDFFLLPFAALGIQDLWRRFPAKEYRVALVIAFLLQTISMQRAIVRHAPLVDDQTFAQIQETARRIPSNVFILALENESVVVLRGWMPDHRVGGPGLFDVPWSYAQWETFLLGSHEERRSLLSLLPAPIVVFVSPHFLSYYGETGKEFLKDSCFPTTQTPWLRWVACRIPGS